MDVVAFPLTKPESPIIFKFHCNESADAFLLKIAENVARTEWYYRNVTNEELKALSNLHDVFHCNNTFFVAGESNAFAELILSLKCFAWGDKAININGFKAYEGIQISIIYQGREKLDERVDEIIVIGR